ncbi:MAG TPA: 5-dehydro-2-deoxygluconokinase [Caulobacteraceae bacterium]|nr:5-dehydro-2-deoxygluconokinase [Caulobacteraceae bacterium]
MGADDFDLITLGRSSVDLYGEQVGGRLEDMGSFAKYIGGSPTNTAVGAARLGLKAALITRVGADHFGRFILEELGREGVDTRAITTDPERLTALAILGIRDREQFPLLFYRRDCADMAIAAADIDPAFIASARAVLINGTHLSAAGVFEASLRAATLARAAGRKLVFDIDYRPVLWGLTAPDAGENRFVADPGVTARLNQVTALCDLIVGTEEEFQILGGEADTVAALKAVRRITDAVLVCKRGPLGCVAFAGAVGEGFAGGVARAGLDIEVFNVLGAGDAFMSGFLRGWLRDQSLSVCCDYANACGAMVVSRHGCAPAMPTWPELDAFLTGGSRPHRLREDEALEHLHWATTRRPDYPELFVLAMDHRSQFADLAAELGVSETRIEGFKALALAAVDHVAGDDPHFGLLLDGRFGARALEQAVDHPYWIGRPIEVPGSRPLDFEGGPDVAATLREWPLRQTVKCLVLYHPDDEEDPRARQERQLLRLFDACRKTRRELLLEIITPRGMAADASTVARAMSRIYDLGVRPDWWKLEPNADPAAWRAVAATLEARDPLCRGVVLLGQSAHAEVLVAAFKAAAAFDMIKGFAVGRTLFAEPARAWLTGAIDDAEAIDALANNFAALVEAWRSAKAAARARTAAE